MQKLNKIRSIITAAVFFLGVVDCISAAEQQDNGWVPLFDGTTLNGWEQKNGTAHYRIEDGAIVGKTTDGSPNSFLCTTKDYADFELEFEVKCDPRLNSGVQIRSKSKSDSGRVNGP